MAEYVLFTESTADLTAELVQQLGVEVLPMLFSLDGKEYNNYPDNRELDPHDFYDALRAGGMSTTSQINQTTFEEAFSPVLEAGKDILYLAFSSGLSGTYHSACLAAEELAAKMWESLNEDNKVSLFVRAIDLATGETEDVIINKYDAVCEE